METGKPKGRSVLSESDLSSIFVFPYLCSLLTAKQAFS